MFFESVSYKVKPSLVWLEGGCLVSALLDSLLGIILGLFQHREISFPAFFFDFMDC